jgi:hypothetical protein
MMTTMMSAQKRTPTPRVVLLKNEQKKKKSSSESCVVKSRPSVKARFPKDIANACERFPSEFELRATLDANRSGGRPEEDAKRSTRNNISSALRLREVFPEVSEASIVFLERDIEAVVRDFREFVVKESDGSWETKKKVVVSLSLLRRTLCTKLHVDHVRVAAMTTYCGKKTEVLDEDSVVHAIVAKAAANEAGPMARALRPVADASPRRGRFEIERQGIREEVGERTRRKLRHFVSERGDVGEREGERTQKSRDDERRMAIGSESGRIRRGE